MSNLRHIRTRRRRGSSWAMDVHRAPFGKVHRVRWSGVLWCIRRCVVGEARPSNYSPGRGMPRAALAADTVVQTIGGAAEENPRSAMSARVAAPCQLIPYAGSRLPPILATPAAMNAVTSPMNSV